MSDLTYEGRPLNGSKIAGQSIDAPMLQAESRSTDSLPSRIDLRPYCTPVEDQKSLNSCVSQAVVGAVELLQRKAGREHRDLSRLFLHYNARKIAGNQDKDVGVFLHHSMAALLAHGLCEERLWPYVEVAVNQEPTQACYANAQHYEAVQFARTPGASVLIALSNELPVSFTVSLPGECYAEAHQTGAMSNPPPGTGIPADSGHTMLIVGYDLAAKTMLVRNSWGRQFGHDGYFTMPIETVLKFASPDDFWTIGAIERAPGLRLMGMGIEEAAASYGAPVQRNASLDPVSQQVRGELEGRLDKAKKDFASRLRGGQ